MTDDAFWSQVCARLDAKLESFRHVSGGDICQAFQLNSSRGAYFVKRLPAARCSILESEELGLRALAATGEIRVPEPVVLDTDARWSYLVLEHLSLQQRTDQSDALLGMQLAKLHRHCDDAYGWSSDNWIGLNPQPNERLTEWHSFFYERRIAPQVALLQRNVPAPGLLKQCEALEDRIEALLGPHNPPPSLLHGDLWGGNQGALEDGTPVIFDPASYYGDRETDLAMTRLFGGFGPSFYEAYLAEWPLPKGFERRQDLYQLYHVLNHANLFGSGYVQQASRLVSRILST